MAMLCYMMIVLLCCSICLFLFFWNYTPSPPEQLQKIIHVETGWLPLDDDDDIALTKIYSCWCNSQSYIRVSTRCGRATWRCQILRDDVSHQNGCFFYRLWNGVWPPPPSPVLRIRVVNSGPKLYPQYWLHIFLIMCLIPTPLPQY